MELLHALFHHVCGQPADRTWLPGGVLLPVCHRCTGLYIGAALAVCLLLWLWPRLSRPFLALHGAFLLGMAPFGLHWIEHGPVVRTITGLAFGAAVVVFLSVCRGLVAGDVRRRTPENPPPHVAGYGSWPAADTPARSSQGFADASTRRYLLALGFAAGAIPALGVFGGQVAAILLTAAIAAGGLCLAVLVLLNGVALGVWLARLSRRRAHPATA